MLNESSIPDRVWQAALAGLLHDVGKFSQRAGVGRSEIWDKETRKQLGYEHALHSNDFLRDFVPKEWREGLSGVVYHHQPRTLPERWIQIADWLSSAERVKGEDEDTEVSTPVLQTTFSRVTLDGAKADRVTYWPLTRLDVSDHHRLFPQPTPPTDWQTAYQNLWKEFTEECRTRHLTTTTSLTPVAYLENLLALLQEFTWCMPSAYWKTLPDVSLYDHLRTTAAIAACLAADDRDAEWCDAIERNQARETALLVVGDFSGIQTFLYSLTSSGAAKSLRARSFYLQLVSEIVAMNLLEALGLPLTNLIYVGGGKFYVLAPMSAQDKLPTLAQQLTDQLMLAHQGALGLTLDWDIIRSNEFAQFNQVYHRVNRTLSRKKRRPFAQASSTMLAQQISVPLTLGGQPEKHCAVTGDDQDLETRGDETKTRFIWSLEELGQALPRTTHLILRRVNNAPSGRPHTWQEGLHQLGFQVLLAPKDKIPSSDQANLIRVWRIDVKAPQGMNLPGELVFADHPIAKQVPYAGERVLTFDELAEQRARGIKRWGVLRMDVDNLGTLFREGLGQHASISRIASLSFGLRLFFEGWLPQLAPGKPEGQAWEQEDLRQSLYIQYSGGDDLFVVGAWNVLPVFALRVRESFREFTGYNPAFSVSGGIAIVESKFPLYQAARLAGDAEDAAKKFKRNGRQKDALAFLGELFDWQSFAETLHRANELANWVEGRLVPKAFLQTVIALRTQKKKAEIDAQRAGKAKPKFGRWTWMAAYQLTRIALDVNKKEEEVKKRILQIQKTFLMPGDEAEQWGFAARWADYLTRGGE